MKAHQKTIGLNDEWLTPPEIIQALGDFDLDPCAPSVRPWSTARRHIALPADGLNSKWEGRVWLNPPFNRYIRPLWMQKMAEHGQGIMLIPAATETEAFHAHVWERANSVLFMRGRPHFHFIDGTRADANSGTAIVLVSYSDVDTDVLQKSGLGKVVMI